MMLYPFGCDYSIFLKLARMLSGHGRRLIVGRELKLGFIEPIVEGLRRPRRTLTETTTVAKAKTWKG
jgi:hypothetical protein